MKAYLETYSRDPILHKLNEVYAEASSEADPALTTMQFMSLPREDW